jgi:hypothetical protein
MITMATCLLDGQQIFNPVKFLLQMPNNNTTWKGDPGCYGAADMG